MCVCVCVCVCVSGSLDWSRNWWGHCCYRVGWARWQGACLGATPLTAPAAAASRSPTASSRPRASLLLICVHGSPSSSFANDLRVCLSLFVSLCVCVCVGGGLLRTGQALFIPGVVLLGWAMRWHLALTVVLYMYCSFLFTFPRPGVTTYAVQLAAERSGPHRTPLCRASLGPLRADPVCVWLRVVATGKQVAGAINGLLYSVMYMSGGLATQARTHRSARRCSPPCAAAGVLTKRWRAAAVSHARAVNWVWMVSDYAGGATGAFSGRRPVGLLAGPAARPRRRRRRRQRQRHPPGACQCTCGQRHTLRRAGLMRAATQTETTTAADVEVLPLDAPADPHVDDEHDDADEDDARLLLSR
jgi:hypothetical protein